MQRGKICKHTTAQNMQTCKGPNYGNMKRRKHAKFKFAKDANIQRRKTFKHATAQNLQTFKVVKDGNIQSRKICKYAEAEN